ncbi:MAG: hypothetical protein WCI05_19685 [Myxococcales bacterium]
MLKRSVLSALLGVALFTSSAAWSQKPAPRVPAPRTPAPKQQSGVLNVGEITIVGRVQKPIASVDVSKIQPKLTLAELRQPFLNRIEEAVRRDPF